MTLIRNKPQASDILSDSQVDLFNNNNAIDDSFGDDHYAASDLTANNGKHRVNTTPTQLAHPTTVDDIKFYAMEDSATIGPLQYTKNANDQVPTPITCLQSSSSGITLANSQVTNVLDFTGVIFCFGRVTTLGNILPANTASGNMAFFGWTGSAGFISNLSSSSLLSFRFSGSALQIINSGLISATIDKISWTLTFDRIFTPL